MYTMTKTKIFILAIVFTLAIANIPKETPPGPGASFPKPDPEKGMAVGYDFNKREYKYETDSNRYQGAKAIIVTASSGNMDNNPEPDEYEAEDLKDYLGY